MTLSRDTGRLRSYGFLHCRWKSLALHEDWPPISRGLSAWLEATDRLDTMEFTIDVTRIARHFTKSLIWVVYVQALRFLYTVHRQPLDPLASDYHILTFPAYNLKLQWIPHTTSKSSRRILLTISSLPDIRAAGRQLNGWLSPHYVVQSLRNGSKFAMNPSGYSIYISKTARSWMHWALNLSTYASSRG